ncbi:hypothetical protein FRB94_009570 [Tulasnella sp. JGI-2019a]|nr:hypothetical protein FRB93_012625 [Tulasnella sp. JGI-2019a]KAG9010868.1 hypothetical protein FRB94_009570 [Tulasnella sp. JGI-2019a]KAG9037713.1 hypothetical protein FRB95_004559 [Tulasnella sp. JGI-2019a]
MSTFSFTLYDLSGNLTDGEFRDASNQVAYQIRPRPMPKLTFNFPLLLGPTEIIRQLDWDIAALEHEPWKITLKFGSNDTLGTVQVGERSAIPMADMLRRKEGAEPNGRYFTAIDGQEYFWKPASRRLQCFDRHGGLLAVYEYLMEDISYAKLDVKPLGWSMTTELIATLILNRHAIRHGL